MRKLLYLVTLIVIIILTGCVSQTQYDEVVKENQQLKDKLNLYRNEVGGETKKGSSNNEQNISAKQEYINNFLEIYDFKAAYMDSLLDGRVPGVTFKINNKGNKTLKEVKVIIYFKSADGKIISETSYYPVLSSTISFDSNKGPLKPNYIWQMEKGKFYSAKSVPSEWQEGSAEAKIADIEFQ